MENWTVDSADVEGPYAPDCSSRAAEGFYSGALLGAVWGVIGRASSNEAMPSKSPSIGALGKSFSPHPPPRQDVGRGGAVGHLRVFARGVAGYATSALSTAGVFGVFVGVLNAGTCACERLRGEKDWINNACGGTAAGLSVALLSRHTRSPRMLAAHAVGGAVITSVVAIATGGPAGE
ncbi:unnamed protein product [Ascophyllum nodosum]